MLYGSLSPGGNKIEEIGKVEAYIFKEIPGHLWCDGSTISDTSNPEYERLVYELKKEAGADSGHPYYHPDSDKAVLPDLRGAAIRGVDIAANRDKDGVRKSGSYQADDNKDHTHTVRTRGATQSIDSVAFNNNGDGDIYDITNAALSSGSTEATMKNIALYYLIKY